MTSSDTRRYVNQAAAASSRTARLREQMTRATGLTPSGLILVGVALGSWLLGYFVAGRPLYLLAYGAAAVLLLSWVIGRRPLALEGTRSMIRPRVREGEEISVDVALTAGRRLSTFILEERVPPVLGQHARLPIASLEAGESAGQGYTLQCWRRGVYELGPLTARWGDPFGLTEREAVLAEPFELLVHPAVEPVHDRPLTRLWEDPPVRPPVSKPWPSGMEFYGMRRYEPGDDIRKIVWRVFARTGELMVRESEQGITDRMVMLLDQDVRHHSPGEFSESFESCVRVAASLGVEHLREGYSVTLEGNAGLLAGPLRAGTSQLTLLDALARVEMVKEPLTPAITRLVNGPGRDAHVVIVTPDLERDAASQLKLLIDRGVHVIVAAVIWDELAAETLGTAASMGAQVVELRPGAPIAAAFRHEVGAGRR
ncbi:MAG: hypothetical protein QOJ09_1181 [Actinomycetota bacterium]|nr:hypothetical protein [Actinomycetota bacterium]